MNHRNITRNAEVVRRRQAGQTFVQIAQDMGLTYKAVYAGYSLELKRRAREAEKAEAEKSEAAIPATAARSAPAKKIEQPTYSPSMVQKVHGAPAMVGLSLPTALRLNGARAALAQPRLLAVASKVAEGGVP